MSDWSEETLGRTAESLRGDATFLSGWLPSDPDGREIIREGMDLPSDRLNRLLLCRAPAPSRFWSDVRAIADWIGGDAFSLARSLREASALGAIWQTSHARVRAARDEEPALADASFGLLVAARDATAETIAVEPSPRVRWQEMAERFWSDTEDARASRDIQRAVAASLPLAVTMLPELGLHSVSSWLAGYGIDFEPDAPDRPLRGLLIATRGLGMVFIDGSLPEPDRRFTLAHEVGHFLLDYLEPRRRILREMPELSPVIDGEREPSRAERARALLQRVPIGMHTHLLERDSHGGASDQVEGIEDEASQFAMELLAPWEEVTELVQGWAGDPRGFEAGVVAATRAVQDRFDLPLDVATARAKAGLTEAGHHRGLFDR